MINQIKRMVPLWLKLRAREKIMGLYGIPWNRFDVPVPLMPYLSGATGITMIDVGASKGEFTSSINKCYGIKRALMIEPQPKRCQQLNESFFSPKYSIVCAAVAEKEGHLDMEILNWDYSSSILPVRRDRPEVNSVLDLDVRETIKCRVATLDTICRENSFLHPIDLLKIDVQGAEFLALSGAEDTLSRTRLLWMEVSFQPLYEGSSTIEAIIAICRERGFVLSRLVEGFRAENGELLQADALFIRP